MLLKILELTWVVFDAVCMILPWLGDGDFTLIRTSFALSFSISPS